MNVEGSGNDAGISPPTFFVRFGRQVDAHPWNMLILGGQHWAKELFCNGIAIAKTLLSSNYAENLLLARRHH